MPDRLRRTLPALAFAGVAAVATVVSGGEASADTESNTTSVAANDRDDGVACHADPLPGYLTAEAFLEVVKKKGHDIQSCCKRFHAAEDAVIWTRVKIEASGRVGSVVAAPPAEERLGSCMTTRVKRWRFPKSKAEMHVTLPLRCSQGVDGQMPAAHSAVRSAR